MSERTYYVKCADGCMFEGMTKEQIIAAIAEATGNTPTSVDDAFITKIREQNRSNDLRFWIGTQAEYNEITTPVANCFYIITDDTEVEDLQQAIEGINTEVEVLATEINKRPLAIFQGCTAATDVTLNANVIEAYPIPFNGSPIILGTELTYDSTTGRIKNNTNEGLYVIVSANCYFSPASGNGSARSLMIEDFANPEEGTLAESWSSVKTAIVIPPTLAFINPNAELYLKISGKNGDMFGTMHMSVQVVQMGVDE